MYYRNFNDPAIKTSEVANVIRQNESAEVSYLIGLSIVVLPD